MKLAALILSAASFAVSTATLTILVVGIKKTKQQVEETRTKTNATLRKFKAALADLEV